MIVVCTRPSTLASALDDKSGLIYSGYFQASALQTLAEHRDLQARLALVNGKSWRDYKPLHLDLEARGGKREANEGTNIHAVVQALAEGYDVSAVPEPTRSDGLAVWNYIHEQGWRVLASEAFVVALGLVSEDCAGTLDLLLETPGGRRFVGDIKSVGEPNEGKHKRLSWSIQTTLYAHGQPYTVEPARDRYGRPVIDTNHIGEWDVPVDTTRAVVLEVHRGHAAVNAHWIDLEKGLDYANIACAIRTLRKAADPYVDEPGWVR